MFPYFSDIWYWAYIFLTILLNILVMVSWKDFADVSPGNEMLVEIWRRVFFVFSRSFDVHTWLQYSGYLYCVAMKKLICFCPSFIII